MKRIKEGKELVVAFRMSEKPKEMAMMFDNFVNSFNPEVTEFIENLKAENDTVRNRFLLISLMWVKKLNYFNKENCYDGRNEYSVKTGNDIHNLIETNLESYIGKYKGEIDFNDYESAKTRNGEPVPFEILFVETMSRSHRTLQQSFSEIVFTWLSMLETFETDNALIDISHTINEGIGYRFYKTPLI